MANTNKYIKSRTATKNKNIKPQTIIKCYQINLQHSRTIIDSLLELIEKEGIYVAFIQESHTVHNRVAGVTKGTENLHRPKVGAGQLRYLLITKWMPYLYKERD